MPNMTSKCETPMSHQRVLEFLDILYPDIPDNNFLLIWEPPGRSHWFNDPRAAATFAAKAGQSRDVYFQVGLAGADHGPNKRCHLDEAEGRPVVGLPGVWADIDLRDPVKKQENLPETVEEALKICCGHGFDPTMVVHSGHGAHAYWVFKEIWELDTEKERSAAQAFLRRFKAWIKGNASELGWHIDSVQDLTRVLRLPGTMNFKSTPPVGVKLISFDESRFYNPENIEEFLPEDPGVDVDKNRGVIECDGLVLDPQARVNEIMLEALVDIEPKFAETWAGDNPNLQRNDQGLPGNSYDQSLANYAARAGWSDQHIANLIINFRQKNGDKPEKALRVDYITRTIGNARAGLGAQGGGGYAEKNTAPKKNSPPQRNPPGIQKTPTSGSGSMGDPASPSLDAKLYEETPGPGNNPGHKPPRNTDTATPGLALSDTNGSKDDKLTGMAAIVRQIAKEGDPQGAFGKEVVKALAAMDGNEFKEAKKAIKKQLGKELSLTKLNETVLTQKKADQQAQKAALKQAKQVAQATISQNKKDQVLADLKKDGLPIIQVNNRQIRDVLTDTLDALVQNAKDIFTQQGELVWVLIPDHDDEQTPKIKRHNEDSLRIKLGECANYVAETKDTIKQVNPPREIIRSVLSKGQWKLPELVGIIETPVFRDDHTLLDTPGYDTQTRKFYVPGPGLSKLAIDEKPTQRDAARAVDFINEELLHDFPFIDRASWANMLALLLTPIVRNIIKGCTPMAMINATTAGTGKTLLCELVSIITTGRYGAMLGAPQREEEFEKVLVSAFACGTNLIIFDDVNIVLKANALHRALTSQIFAGRLLGLSQNGLFPVESTFMCSGNNIRVAREIPRRCYWININANTEMPWLRNNFRKKMIKIWTTENRGYVIDALLTIVRAWLVANRPQGHYKKIGTYESWSEIIGGILTYAGVVGFLENAEQEYDKQDFVRAEWEIFLRAWWRKYKNEPQVLRYIYDDFIIDKDRELTPFGEALPEKFRVKIEDSRKNGFLTSLGMGLSKIQDRPFGLENFTIAKSRDTHTRINTWVVQQENNTVDFQKEKEILLGEKAM